MCLYMCVVPFWGHVGVFGQFVNAMWQWCVLVLVLVLWKSQILVEPRQVCETTHSCLRSSARMIVSKFTFSVISGRPLFSGTNEIDSNYSITLALSDSSSILYNRFALNKGLHLLMKLTKPRPWFRDANAVQRICNRFRLVESFPPDCHYRQLIIIDIKMVTIFILFTFSIIKKSSVKITNFNLRIADLFLILSVG